MLVKLCSIIELYKLSTDSNKHCLCIYKVCVSPILLTKVQRYGASNEVTCDGIIYMGLSLVPRFISFFYKDKPGYEATGDLLSGRYKLTKEHFCRIMVVRMD